MVLLDLDGGTPGFIVCLVMIVDVTRRQLGVFTVIIINIKRLNILLKNTENDAISITHAYRTLTSCHSMKIDE